MPAPRGSEPQRSDSRSSTTRPWPPGSETIVSLSKRRGFVYPCSEIYGGQRAAWDYGPLGVELKENLKR
ncbi:hypothetical protein, partial [Streptomyces clavuligerus]|uniref:hypothetical protein n=1 Tax=Streptomyces clavuligerus TaxID=1901 RepID=UPI001E3C69A3